ncbi:MAG: type II toxin-antitoxin system RelE/ParE family toxin [Deltaproteobacteria bacterium]|nr:type II toxin-antitoxin system RelE/ParE family toxin [Deltaproteobacteria bacterium]
MYEILIEKAAERDLKKLSAADFERIIPHLNGLAEQARPAGSRKIGGSEHDWRIRVGTYRVIYEIDEKGKTVKILRVRHRREVYR